MRTAFKSVSPAQRRDAILAVAREVFLEQGYAAASMSTIAARLGGSKGTLYNYFKNKEELFAAHVENHCQALLDALLALDAGVSDLRLGLVEIAHRYLQHLLEPETVGTFRMVIVECERSPELARIFYEAGPANGRLRLAERLEAAQAHGEIKAADTSDAARHFFALCKGGLYFERLLNLIPAPDDSAIHAEAEGVAEVFLAAYGTDRKGTDAKAPST